MNRVTDLPHGWIKTTLGDAGEWYGGGTPSKSESKFWSNGNIPWISPKDMKRFRLSDSEDHISTSALEETNVRRFPKGTVLMVIRSGILSRTFPVAIADEPATMNQDMKGVKPSKDIDPSFLAYQLRAKEHELLRQCSKNGTTVASIDTLSLRSFPIWLAPLSEQRRIVGKIEKLFGDLDAGVAALERVRANLKRYRAAVLNAAVTGKLTGEWRAKRQNMEPARDLLLRILDERQQQWESSESFRFSEMGKAPPKEWKLRYDVPRKVTDAGPKAIPSNWIWATFEQVTHEITVGHVGPMKDRYVDKGIAFLRSQNVRPLRFDPLGLQRIPLEFDLDLKKSRLFGGELLVVRSGVNVGDACIFPKSMAPANCSDLVISRPTSLFLAKYGAIYIASPSGQAALHLRRTGNAQPHFNIGAMEKTPFPLPPIEEQEQIIAEVERRLSVVDAIEADVNHGLQKAARLRQSILKRAFEGKLVPQHVGVVGVAETIHERRPVLSQRIKSKVKV